MEPLPTSYYVALSAILFTLGVAGELTRRNAIIIFMSGGLMLDSAHHVFVAFGRPFMDLSGQVFVFFVMTVAAAEVAVGLALIVTIFRTKKIISVHDITQMKASTR